MKNVSRRILRIACAIALAVALTVALSQPAHAARVTPPSVPTDLQVESGNKAFLVGHATGTQNYVCKPRGDGVAYVLFTPQATLFNDDDEQVITHFFSPNPDEDNTDPTVVAEQGLVRATWQHSRDTSTVWAKLNPKGSSSDPAFVRDGAIAWLLLKMAGVQDGPTGGDTLTKTTFIQRVNTSGGLAPATGCDSLADVGNQAFMPYTADYFFYTKDDGN